MDWKDLLSAALITIAVVVVAVFLFGKIFDEAESNRAKQIELTKVCVSEGHTGWDSDLGCFGGNGN